VFGVAMEDPSRALDRSGRVQIFAKCVSDTVDFINSRSPGAVEGHPTAGVLLTNCYFLVSDAYKRRRGMQDSRTHKSKVAALTVATIMAIRPIRVAEAAHVVSTRVAFSNQQCAMRAAQALLGLDLERMDEDFIRRLYDAVFDHIELPCLTPYLAAFEAAYNPPRPVTFEDVEARIDFNAHNTLTLSPTELAALESLINQFTTLEQAAGHPFLRLLQGWRWPWS
jgi:hypothetical protein